MEWIQFLSGIGLGTFAAKLLDIFWLQGRLEQQQKTTWLREKRLEAFTDVTKELISFGLHEKDLRSPFESYGAVSKALLLLDDDGITKRIDRFVVELDRLNRLIDSKDSSRKKESDELYQSLVVEAREITGLLRNVILHGCARTTWFRRLFYSSGNS